MAIDPQSIASIGQNAPDIAGSTMKAYTLADAVNRQQLGQMQLASEKEEQADLAKLKTLSQDPKYSLATPEGQNAYVAEALKINPRLGMQLQKQMNETQRGAIELGDAKIKQYQERLGVYDDIIAPAGGLVEQNEKLPVGDPKKLSPADLKMRVVSLVSAPLNAAKSQKLSYGESVIRPEDAQQVAQLLSIQDPAQFLSAFKQLYDSHQGAKDKIMAYQQKKTALENVESEIESRGNKIETVMQNGKPMRVEFDKKGNQIRVLGEAPPTAATVQVGGGGNQTLLGELAIRGINLQSRTAGAVLSGLKKNYPGKTDAEIADMVATGQATLAGTKAEKRAEGAQVGKVDIATREIPQFAEQALAASAKIPRGEFKPFNRLRLLADSEFSNPDLKELKSYLNSLSNAYDVAAARGGTDVNKRAEAHAMLDAADSPEVLARAIKVMQKEAGIALKAGQEALHGSQTSTPAVTKPPTESPPLGTPRDGGGGPKQGPAVGTIVKGHRYKGGDPSQQSSWEKVGG
jgi:hypothetical protein